MARRYTITNVTEEGSGVQSFRAAISGSTTPGSTNKGFSDDSRMKAMFPKSPLYMAIDSGGIDDNQVITTFKTSSIDITSQSNYDFSSTQPAYMNFGHPQAPSLKMENMNTPVSGAIHDKPYYGHPNLQVNSINPLDERTTETGTDGGLLRKRTNEDGGFGTKNSSKNYATQDVQKVIGTYFTKIYSSNTADSQALGKINSMGNSTMSDSTGNNAPSNPNENLSKDVNNFRIQSST